MTIQEFANKLNGNQYGDEMNTSLVEEARENGFVVMFGESDDSVELKGAIWEEVGVYDQLDILFCKGYIFDLEEPFDNLQDQIDFLKKYGVTFNFKKVTAIWDEKNPFVWSFKTDIPHATFDIFEDQDPFCKGIVFKVSSIQ